jgi:hypothetical protein
LLPRPTKPRGDALRLAGDLRRFGRGALPSAQRHAVTVALVLLVVLAIGWVALSRDTLWIHEDTKPSKLLSASS